MSVSVSEARRLAAIGRLMGWRWVAFRVGYACRLRSGRIRRATPLSDWPDLGLLDDVAPLSLDRSFLRTWLDGNYGADDVARLVERADGLRSGRFDVFGAEQSLKSWFHDPVSDHEFRADVHWSEVHTPEGCDIKRVWEPSRFAWAFDLVRLNLLQPEFGAGELFCELLDDWMAENPPNHGVNWACGQEAAIRLMAVTTASQMLDDPSGRGRQLAQLLALVSGERIEANISYARSQQNNHHLSEAVGLVNAAYLCPGSSKADRWLALGLRHASEVSEKLIFPDGGSSQYSVNYHRVFLHNFCFLFLLLEAMKVDVPEPIRAAFARATAFLSHVMEPTSGFAPVIGNDDGARLLPWSNTPHRYMRADVDLCRALLGDESACVSLADQEPAAWLGVERALVPAVERRSAVRFADFGLTIMSVPPWRVYVRCGDLQFRPSQDDQLHCDVWLRGENIAFDPGTVSYHPAEGEPGDLGEARFHNTMRAPDADSNMVRLSKFLWGGWPSTSSTVEDTGESIVGRFECRWPSGRTDTRVVEVSVERISVEDRSTALVISGWNRSAHDASVEAVDIDCSSGYDRRSVARRFEPRPSKASVTSFEALKGEI